MSSAKRGQGITTGLPKGYVTVREAMRIARCSDPTVRRLIRRGAVRVVRWRNRVLLLKSDLQAWLNIRPYKPENPPPTWAWRRRHETAQAAAAQNRQVEP